MSDLQGLSQGSRETESETETPPPRHTSPDMKLKEGLVAQETLVS